MRENRTLVSSMIVAGAMSLVATSLEERVRIDPPRRASRPRPTPPPSSYTHWRGERYASNGDRETARRRQQIAAGQLTRANGLVA